MSASEGARNPGRPSLPPLLWALLVVVIAEQVVLRCSCTFAARGAAIAAIAVIAGMCACGAGLRKQAESARFIALLSVSAVIGIAVSGMLVDTARAGLASLSETPISSWTFSITGDAREQNGRYRMRARAELPGAVPSDVWLYSTERLFPGMSVRGIGRLRVLEDGSWADASRAQGINASVTLVKIVSCDERGGLLGGIDRMRQSLIGVIDPSAEPTRAFIAACVLGDRTGFDALGMNDSLRRCGISHLVAVSGTHLALVTASCAMALEASQTRMRIRSFLLICAAGLFVLLCGAPASAVRAWLMQLSVAAAHIAGRRNHGLSALCASALSMALIDPAITGQLAYQLSVSAVFGIYVVNPYLRYMFETAMPLPRLPRRIPRVARRRMAGLWTAARDLFALSVTAQIVTLPITAGSFSEISLVAPFANLIASPLIAVLTVMGLIACAVSAIPALSGLLIAGCVPFGTVLVRLILALASLPFSAVTVPSYAQAASCAVLAAVLVLVWKAPNLTRTRIMAPVLAAISIAVIWYVRCRYLAPARIVVLDVGQGDAILIQEGPYAVLVDAGPAGPLDEALLRNGVFHLDAIVLSHLHNDHYGGVADLAGSIRCDAIVVARGSAAYAPQELEDAARSLDALPFVEVGYLDELSFGHFMLTVVAPTQEVDGLDNEDSMFLLLCYENGVRTMDALLIGDGESLELAHVMARFDLGGIDVLKVGHHGSDGSITAGQAAELGARYAVASAGAGNEFGHPSNETVQVLVDARSTFICTKDAGDIVLVPTSNGALLSRW